MSQVSLPAAFFKWAYKDRAEMVRNMAQGKMPAPEKLFLSFTRHNPVFVSHGPSGLNGSVKGVGFVPKKELLPEITEAYLYHIKKGWREGYSKEGLDLLVKHIWSEKAQDNLDFSIMGSLELAKKHSWDNYRVDPSVTLVFFEPPMISFEVRGTIEILKEGPYHQFINAQHDVYHKPNPERWSERPCYIVHIEEIYDNSASKEGFGTRLLPVL